MKKHIQRALLGVAMFAVSAANVWAQTNTDYRYTHLSRFKEDARYESSGVVVYPREAYPAKIYDVRPHQMLKKLFPGAVVGTGDNQATSDGLWRNLLGSGYVMGSSTDLTRGQDLTEDWHINFVDPKTPDRNYWFAWYADNVPAGVYVGYGQTLLNGPQKGARVMGNPSLLAVGDDRTVWLDPDGSLSYYLRGTGTLDLDSTATTFPNGPKGWSGTTLRSHLRQLIGYEEGKLYFLEGERTLHVYDRNLTFMRTDEIYLSGELIENSLGSIVDGKVPGLTYIGWDLGPVIGFFTRFMTPQ